MLLVWIVITLFIVASLAATIVLYAAVAASSRATAELDRHRTPPARRPPNNASVRDVRLPGPSTRPGGEWAQPQ